MQIEILEVTPGVAKMWLAANTRNRPESARFIDDYAARMAAGTWTLNGEAVKIAEDGTLLDGQTRLAACVKAGVPFTTVVVTGLPNEAQDTMDQGRKRSAGNVFSMHGEVNANVLAAVARRAAQWESGNHRFTGTENFSPADLLKIVDEYPSLRRSADMAVRTHHDFRPLLQSVTGTAHHILLHVDADDCAQFYAHLGTGAGLTDGHPILALRDRFLRDKMANKKFPFYIGVALHIRAWNAVREGRDMAKIQQGPDDKMPMPV